MLARIADDIAQKLRKRLVARVVAYAARRLRGTSTTGLEHPEGVTLMARKSAAHLLPLTTVLVRDISKYNSYIDLVSSFR